MFVLGRDSSSSSLPPQHWLGSNSWHGQGYFPSFPATSPYVTSIGATMGPEDPQDGKEVRFLYLFLFVGANKLIYVICRRSTMN